MAYGAPFSPDLPRVSSGAGVKTPFGITLLPPGSRIGAFVRSTGAQIGDDPFTNANLVPTLAAGLARCRAGLGDTVVVMPGHSESVTDATMFTGAVAGTRIVGFGRGSNMPTFRWTATTSQWAVAVANLTIQNLRLRIEGAVVVKGIVITAADVGIYGCDFEVSSGASNLATIALEIGAGADRTEICGNLFRGVAAGANTDVIKVVSTPDAVRITDNEGAVAGAAGTGMIHVTTVATNIKILRNIISNITAASTACVLIDNVAATGVVADNYCGVLNDGTASAQGVILTGAGAVIKCFQNFCSDQPSRSGLLAPAVVT